MIDVSLVKQTNKKNSFILRTMSQSLIFFFLNFTAEETYKETYRI